MSWLSSGVVRGGLNALTFDAIFVFAGLWSARGVTKRPPCVFGVCSAHPCHNQIGTGDLAAAPIVAQDYIFYQTDRLEVVSTVPVPPKVILPLSPSSWTLPHPYQSVGEPPALGIYQLCLWSAPNCKLDWHQVRDLALWGLQGRRSAALVHATGPRYQGTVEE